VVFACSRQWRNTMPCWRNLVLLPLTVALWTVGWVATVWEFNRSRQHLTAAEHKLKVDFLVASRNLAVLWNTGIERLLCQVWRRQHLMFYKPSLTWRAVQKLLPEGTSDGHCADVTSTGAAMYSLRMSLSGG